MLIWGQGIEPCNYCITHYALCTAPSNSVSNYDSLKPVFIRSQGTSLDHEERVSWWLPVKRADVVCLCQAWQEVANWDTGQHLTASTVTFFRFCLHTSLFSPCVLFLLSFSRCGGSCRQQVLLHGSKMIPNGDIGPQVGLYFQVNIKKHVQGGCVRTLLLFWASWVAG